MPLPPELGTVTFALMGGIGDLRRHGAARRARAARGVVVAGISVAAILGLAVSVSVGVEAGVSVPLSAAPAAPSTPEPEPSTPEPSPTDRPYASDDPADPMSPAYNPYLDPANPAFVSEAERAQWLARQAVVRECMADAGFVYLEWRWWHGGSPMPWGLDEATAHAWMSAYRGTYPEHAGQAWAEDGCSGAGRHAAAVAAAKGTPLHVDPTEPPEGQPTERQRWLEFQAAVRTCMAHAGFEYRYWEYWNPAYRGDRGSPAMPEGLTDDETAAWEIAAYGHAGHPGGAPLTRGGCWSTGADETRYSTFDE